MLAIVELSQLDFVYDLEQLEIVLVGRDIDLEDWSDLT
jgi:hypothetical protein